MSFIFYLLLPQLLYLNNLLTPINFDYLTILLIKNTHIFQPHEALIA